MNKNIFLNFAIIFLGGITLIITALFLPSYLNKFLTATVYTPPQCPFHVGLTPNQITTDSELSLKQEAILLKLFFTQAVVDNQGIAICKETDSLNTCLARFQNLCYQKGKCTTRYDSSKDATLTPEIQSYLCSLWNQLSTKLFTSTSWTKVTSLFSQLNTPVPNWLTTAKQSFIAYQQSIQEQQIPNQINTFKEKVINSEDNIIQDKISYKSSFETGEKINISNPEIKNKSLVLNPANDIGGNSLQQKANSNNFTITNPRIRISKTNDGSYVGEWFVTDAPSGLITIEIFDKNKNRIYFDQVFSSGQTGVVFKEFTLDKNMIDPTQEYTFIISAANNQKTGTYTFSGEALAKGGAIIDNIITTQYYPQKSYLSYVNAAVSKDGKTLSLDLEVHKGAGPTLAYDITALVIKNTKTNQTQTIAGDELLKVLGGMKINVNLDLSNSKDFVVELINSSGAVIEEYKGNVNESGFVQLTKTVSGASGYGSVYDPIVTYTTESIAKGKYLFSIHIKAAGASITQVIDAATGLPIATYEGSDFYISGSQDKYKQGYTYYIVMYDQLGNISTIEKFTIVNQRDKSIDIEVINKPPTFSNTCGGQYVMRISDISNEQIKTITINGKSYTLEEAKQLGVSINSIGDKEIVYLTLNKNISSSLKDITVVYIDKLGVEQSVSYEIREGKVVMTNFSNNLAQLKPPPDKQIGNSVQLNNGAVLTYYKNDQLGKYYVKVENYQGLKIESIHFGYSPYDNNPSYKQEIIKHFYETGELPAGCQITFEDGTVIYISSGESTNTKLNPLHIVVDKTKKIEEPKIEIDKINGKITIPITKINEENKELNEDKNYNDPIVQAILNEIKNDSYCKQHACSISQGAFTVTINPFNGKITIEVDETIKKAEDEKRKEEESKKEKAQEEVLQKAINEVNQKVADGIIKTRTDYEKALNKIPGISDKLKNELLKEYDAEFPSENSPKTPNPSLPLYPPKDQPPKEPTPPKNPFENVRSM